MRIYNNYFRGIFVAEIKKERFTIFYKFIYLHNTVKKKSFFNSNASTLIIRLYITNKYENNVHSLLNILTLNAIYLNPQNYLKKRTMNENLIVLF